VDAVSYLALGRVFTANMTGNTVLFGLSLAQGDADGAGRAALALGGFLVGSALGGWIAYQGPREAGWPRGVTIALIVECVFLAALANDRSEVLGLRVVFAAVAMGIQSAAARRLDVLGVTTTFITGTLTSLATLIARHGVLPSASGHGKRFLAAVWGVYILGAVVAGAAVQVASALVWLIPVAIVATVVGTAAARFWRT
jgi:uncharacterized membrane protein YoaK (UPF0700 family)